MSDVSMRTLERLAAAGDQQAHTDLLHAKVRCGELTKERVALYEYLRAPVGQVTASDASLQQWLTDIERLAGWLSDPVPCECQEDCGCAIDPWVSNHAVHAHFTDVCGTCKGTGMAQVMVKCSEGCPAAIVGSGALVLHQPPCEVCGDTGQVPDTEGNWIMLAAAVVASQAVQVDTCYERSPTCTMTRCTQIIRTIDAARDHWRTRTLESLTAWRVSSSFAGRIDFPWLVVPSLGANYRLDSTALIVMICRAASLVRRLPAVRSADRLETLHAAIVDKLTQWALKQGEAV